MSPGELSASMARRLRARPPTTLDATRGPAIKRNVHEIVVAAPADQPARAFEATRIEPGARWAGLTILREPDRAGAPFEIGERFQSAFTLPGGAAGRWLARRLTRDYAHVELLERGGPGGVWRARYRYLAGAPLAGSSTITIAPDALTGGAGAPYSEPS